MIVLSLDPAISTGYCLVDVNEETSTADIFEYGFIKIRKDAEYQGDQCIELMNKLREIIQSHEVKYITVEDFFFSKRTATGSTLNIMLRTAIYILARELGLEYSILKIMTWKKYVAGRATPLKEQVSKWGKEAAKKLYIQQALWENYSFRFPNHSLSERSGKPVLFCLDIIDVVGQAVYFCGSERNIKNITMSVIAPEDVSFKKLSKRCFVYPEMVSTL